MKRFFLIAAILLILCVTVLAYAFLIEPQRLEVTHVRVQNNVNNASFTIAVFSDLHVGNGVEAEDVLRYARKINELDCDVVVFLGDLFDDYSAYDRSPDDVIYALSLIKGAKFAVWGNHDIGGGAERVYASFMERAGFILLENNSFRLMDGVSISGSADLIFSKYDVRLLPGDDFDVLLCHEPSIFNDGNAFELQLSGHTHGGQIRLPFVSERMLPPESAGYIAGRYTDRGRVLYVNRGLGMSGPRARFMAVPEITVIEVAP